MRAHWQAQANTLLRRHHASGESARMLVIGIVDPSQQISGTHGRTVGGAVTRAVGQTRARLRACVHAHGCAGRHGGGEFAVACSHTLPAEALGIAQRIRKRIETLRPAAGIGLSPAERRHRTLRGWTHG